MITVVNDELLVIRLSGTFDVRTLNHLAQELNRIERDRTYPKRLVYVEALKDVAITADDIAFYRSCRPEPSIETHTAFCALTDFQYGMARMFQSFLESRMNTIDIFRDIESAARWLDVDPQLVGAA